MQTFLIQLKITSKGNWIFFFLFSSLNLSLLRPCGKVPFSTAKLLYSGWTYSLQPQTITSGLPGTSAALLDIRARARECIHLYDTLIDVGKSRDGEGPSPGTLLRRRHLYRLVSFIRFCVGWDSAICPLRDLHFLTKRVVYCVTLKLEQTTLYAKNLWGKNDELLKKPIQYWT